MLRKTMGSAARHSMQAATARGLGRPLSQPLSEPQVVKARAAAAPELGFQAGQDALDLLRRRRPGGGSARRHGP